MERIGYSPARTPQVVVLEGSPVEMGLTHGGLLAGEIRYLVDRMNSLILRRLGSVAGTGLQAASMVLAMVLDSHVPPRLRQELRGVAAGSGVPYRKLSLLNSIDDVLNILRRFAPAAPSLGCSSFAIAGRRTRDGALLHGRNLDYHFRGTPLDDQGAVARLLLEQTVLFVHRPRGGAAFLSVGWPGIVGVSTAVNEAGVSLGHLTSYLRAATPNGTPAMMIYRSIMEDAGSLREVGPILRASHRTIGNNLLVASAREDRALLFELTRDAVEEVEPRDGVLVAANHFTTPALARRQRPYVLPHSVDRFGRLCELTARDRIAPEEAARFLADREQAAGKGMLSRVGNEGTAVSALFNVAAGEVWLGCAPEPPASDSFVRLEISKLLGMAATGRDAA